MAWMAVAGGERDEKEWVKDRGEKRKGTRLPGRTETLCGAVDIVAERKREAKMEDGRWKKWSRSSEERDTARDNGQDGHIFRGRKCPSGRSLISLDAIIARFGTLFRDGIIRGALVRLSARTPEIGLASGIARILVVRRARFLTGCQAGRVTAAAVGTLDWPLVFGQTAVA